MMDLVSIGFKIKAEGLAQANKEIDSLLTKVGDLDKKAPTKSTKAVEDTGKAAARASKDLAVLNKQVEYLKEGLSKATSLKLAKLDIAGVDKTTIANIRNASVEVERLGKSFGQLRVTSQGLDLRALVGVGSTAAIIGATATSVFNLADAMTLLEGRAKLVTPATESIDDVMRRLTDTSIANRASLDANINLYNRLQPALRRFGKDTDDVMQIVDAFGKTLLLSGATTREAAAATLQFSQAMGSGKLAGDRQICHPTE